MKNIDPEVLRLRREVKALKKQLSDEIIDHRIDTALLEILTEEQGESIDVLKKKREDMKLRIV